MTTKPNPVIFIHGLWIHASAWQPWMDLFAERGYTSSAPGWPGDAETVAATRDNADARNDVGIAQVVDHYANLIGTAGGKHETRPVVIGHSFGGSSPRNCSPPVTPRRPSRSTPRPSRV
jgi:alpha-beta hydrolase superfamily lysophospholipase